MDKYYINYRKSEELTGKGMVYVTKMKNLTYKTLVDCTNINPDGLKVYREQSARC